MAEESFTDVRVVNAGVNEAGDVLIFLSHDDADATKKFAFWATAIAGAKREMLSTALTAVATGYRCQVYLRNRTDNAGDLLRLYVTT